MGPSREARAFARELLAAYPGRTTTEGNVKALAEALDDIGLRHADDIIAMLQIRSVDPPSVAQVYQVSHEVKAETMSSGYASLRCGLVDGVECPQCGVIHGHELPADQVFHGIFHMRAHLRGEPDQLESAMWPESCPCKQRSVAAVATLGAEIAE